MGNCCSSGTEDGDPNNSQSMRHYDPVRYMPDRQTIRSPNRIVSRVHFVAQTVLQSGGNHWTMYLQTGSHESVRINMNPGELRGARVPGHGYRGQMEIILRNHPVTRNQQIIVSIPAFPGHPVAHFIDAIIDAGNHEYDFTTEGRGCTGWMLDQYELFTRLSLIRPDFTAIRDAINLEWVNGRPTDTRTATRGFYMRETRGGGWSRTSGSGQPRTRG